MAFYRPSFLSPESIAISGSQNNDFSCQVNVSGETVTNYRLKILSMANASIYDTGTVSASPNKFDKERLYHTVPSGTLTNGNQYKWAITTNPSAATPVYSKETAFWAYSTPTVVFNSTPTTITAKSYNFVCTYTQAQSVPFTKWRMIWYDVSNSIIEDSGWNYSGYISHTFDGFTDTATYKVKCFVENQVGVIVDTDFYIFLVDYSAPNIDVSPVTTLYPDIGAVEVAWGRAVQITGDSTGTIGYYPDFMVPGNFGLALDSSTPTVYFDNLNIPASFTTKFVWQKTIPSILNSLINYTPTNTSEALVFTKDLGVASCFDNIVLTYYVSGYMTGDFTTGRFEYSTDNTNWYAFGTPQSLFYSPPSYPDIYSTSIWTNAVVTARYFRMYATANATSLTLVGSAKASNSVGYTGGVICSLDNSKYVFSYNVSTKQFSLSGTSFPDTLYSPIYVLNDDPYLIALLQSKAYIIQNNALVTSVEV